MREVREFAADMGGPTLCLDGVTDRERVAFHEALGEY